MEPTSFTLLVVDDEADVRDLLRDVLVGSGYRVVTAADGVEALPLLDEVAVDLLVTDLMMPGMDGRELVERARRQRPELPVLMISGYSRDPLLVGEGLDFLPKPFSLRELREAVRGALPSGRRARSAKNEATVRGRRRRSTKPGGRRGSS